MARMSASIRSSTPPCPGRILPESLIPALRLYADSRRSPTCPATFPTAAIPRRYCNGAWIQRTKTSATISEPRKLATVPSHVFFGLRCGARACLPIDRPTKYAAVSPTHVITNAKSNSSGPCEGKPWSRIVYDKGNATRINPLELIPAAGSASTIGRLVNSVNTAIPRTNRNNVPGMVGGPPKNLHAYRYRHSQREHGGRAPQHQADNKWNQHRGRHNALPRHRKGVSCEFAGLISSY